MVWPIVTILGSGKIDKNGLKLLNMGTEQSFTGRVARGVSGRERQGAAAVAVVIL